MFRNWKKWKKKDRFKIPSAKELKRSRKKSKSKKGIVKGVKRLKTAVIHKNSEACYKKRP